MGKHPIHSLLLAGGLSSRMGTDKALLLIEGKPLLCLLVEQLRALTEHVILSVGSSEREAIYRGILGDMGESVSFALDRYPGCGPLSGLHAGLSAVTEGYVFVMACDMPQLSEELLTQLMGHLESGADVIHASGQPFHALYHTRAVPQIAMALDEQDFRVMRLLGRLQTVVVSPLAIGGKAIFTNLNTPDDYSKYAGN
ncbi:molybdenum cofactor guanylyltransferase [Paenibacillus sp. PL91]|uniref:molybdenum cofactor guanylyltransferase n=1 Tax=Paenibacillus sp. PL91 TaxID=2729538 RepID=UPI00145E8A21|nr:molybdenum cofactor guanylyltransferase [Paenibacillus sp. PL91]MBC9201794.1 molybdenum cofactor guanylyltransferase [Paenibacillus sp. PL91]